MVSSLLLNKVKSIKNIITLKDDRLNFEIKINTDSRTFIAGQTFVALEGESFDGYNYLEMVLEKGAKAIVVKSTPERENFIYTLMLFYPKTIFITVEDSLLFLQELAKEHVKSWKKLNKKKTIIGITGSNGKTTHKEMLTHLLSSTFPGKILATKGNLNNHIGVPLTVLGLSKKHDVAIVEMGMNHAGEIKVLCDIALPDHGMITNIGAAHIEFLKSMDNILKEKGTLYDEVIKNSKGKGVFVVNADDENLRKLKRTKGLKTYGENFGDIKVKITGQEIVFTINKLEMLITNKNISERHNLKNLIGTTLFCLQLFPAKQAKIIKAAEEYSQPSMNRSQWVDHIYLDAYNANPSSMRVSLDSFVAILKERKISLDECYFVLGDMNELGEFASKLHSEIAQYTKELGIKNITFIGRFKDFYLLGQPHPASQFKTKEEFHNEWKIIRKKYKYIFVKASRSLQLETLMTIL